MDKIPLPSTIRKHLSQIKRAFYDGQWLVVTIYVAIILAFLLVASLVRFEAWKKLFSKDLPCSGATIINSQAEGGDVGIYYEGPGKYQPCLENNKFIDTQRAIEMHVDK